MGRKKNRPEIALDQPPTWLWAPVIVLLLLGLGSSIYLLHLFLAVHSANGPQVESFCAVSDVFNCVTVANSSYSAFAGIPIALFGVEFFAVASLAVLLTLVKAWPIRRWDSLIFVAVTLALPACGVLAWISAVRIKSFCLMCALVYAINLSLFLLLVLAGRKHWRALLLEGPRQLLSAMSQVPWGIALGLIAVLALSQIVWVPQVMESKTSRPAAVGVWQGLPTAGVTIGSPTAPLKIEEFTDFQCPHCNRAHELMIDVLTRFPGKIFLVHRDFPLDIACNPIIKRPFHPNACRAAYYARCAAQQGKYWPYEALLFQNRQQLEEDHLRSFAAQLGLDLGRIDQCLANAATRQAILDDIQTGIGRGLRGTPTFFANGEMVVGIQPLAFWEDKIWESRKKKATATPPR
jgi:protein-disulfide isomerase/uncharacterized membrane protein